MGHFFAVDCMIWWVTTTLTHWGQVYIDYGKRLLLVRFQAVTWNWYCHINEIRTQWVEDHSIHCMYIYSWNWFLIVLNTAIKDFELNWFELNWLSRIVVRIIANDIACEWRRCFPYKFGVRSGSTSMPNQNDLIRWLFANQCESDTN